MAAEHDGAGADARDPWPRAATDALVGVPAAPVATAPLDAGPAALVDTPVRRWNDVAAAPPGTPVLVAYSFATRHSSHYSDSGAPAGSGFLGDSEPFDAAQRASIRRALDLWEQASGLFFIEVPDAPNRSTGGIRFFLEDIPTPNTHGRSLTPLPYGAEVTMQRQSTPTTPCSRGADRSTSCCTRSATRSASSTRTKGSPNCRSTRTTAPTRLCPTETWATTSACRVHA